MANTEQALNKAKSALEDIARLYESNRDEATIMQAQLLYDTRCIARTTLSEIEALTAASAEAAMPVVDDLLTIPKSELIRTDDYGVHGSTFYACRLCEKESSAGILNKAIEALNRMKTKSNHWTVDDFQFEAGKVIEALTAASAEAATPVASVLISADGVMRDFQPRVREFFGAIIDDDAYIHDADDIAKADLEYAGLAPHRAALLYTAAPQARQPIGQPEYNGEGWELLAMALAEEDHDDIHHLIYEGYPPEPWGEVWQRYEGDAKRMIELVRKHVPAASNSQPVSGAATDERKAFEGEMLKRWPNMDLRRYQQNQDRYMGAEADTAWCVWQTRALLSASGQAVSEKAEAYKQGYELGLKMQRASDENSGADIRKAALDAAIDACKAVEEGQQSLADMHRDEEGYITENGIPYSNKALGANHCIDAIRALSSTPAQQTEGDK